MLAALNFSSMIVSSALLPFSASITSPFDLQEKNPMLTSKKRVLKRRIIFKERLKNNDVGFIHNITDICLIPKI
jgi:hypothetical protein